MNHLSAAAAYNLALRTSVQRVALRMNFAFLLLTPFRPSAVTMPVVTRTGYGGWTDAVQPFDIYPILKNRIYYKSKQELWMKAER